MQGIFCWFASLQCYKQPLLKMRQQYLNVTTVSGMHIAHGLMHRSSPEFEWGEG